MNIIRAESGMVYRNKMNGMLARVLILGVGDSIGNYDLIPEPEPEETEVPDDGESADPV